VTEDIDGNPTAPTGGVGAGIVTVEMKDVIFNAGGQLNLFYANLDITGDVDMSALDPDDLNIWIDAGTGKGAIRVLEGAELTISVEQMVALAGAGIPITGSGTIHVEGDATDVPGAAFGFLNTINVDLSGVTIDTAAGPDQDADLLLDVDLGGAYDDDTVIPGGYGTPNSGQNVTGSAFSDNIDFALGDLDDTITAGGDEGSLGDPSDPSDDVPGDTFRMYEGNNTIIVDEGFDSTVALDGVAGQQDVVQVAAGTEFLGNLSFIDNEFVATADTTNDGVARIETDSSGDGLIDMSLAGGANGWTIFGSSDASTDLDTLIGSDQDDVINGGNISQTSAAAVDVMTGNGGADIFVFNHGLSTPVDPIVAETQTPIDEETIDLTADGADENNEGLVVTIAINGVSAAYAVDLSGVNATDDSAITAATATQLNAIAGISASVSGGLVSVIGDNGNSVAILGVAPTGTVTTLAGVIANGAGDVAEISQITIDSVVSLGEIYSALVTLADGTTIGAEYEAGQGGDPVTQVDVRNGLLSELNDAITAVGGTTVTATAGGSDGVIIITDDNANNGGFTLVADVSPSVVSTGASLFGAGAAAFADNFVDQITDFMTGEDSIDLNADAGDGTATNYMEGAEELTYAAALATAGGVIDETVSYYMTSTADDGGLLFFDADGNGSIDGVVNLVGLDENSFDFGDIIA
jgi:hypothetical protein